MGESLCPALPHVVEESRVLPPHGAVVAVAGTKVFLPRGLLAVASGSSGFQEVIEGSVSRHRLRAKVEDREKMRKT